MHFGIPDTAGSHERERLFCRWIDSIKESAESIYLVGDIFDFWMEYNRAVPKGYTRFLGKLSEITDAGIPVYIMRGNHDTWLKGYLEEECGCTYLKGIQRLDLGSKRFFVHHGDGLAPKGKDKSYKLLKKLLNNRIAIWLYSGLHPNWGIKLALFFSKRSRMAGGQADDFKGGENEWLTQYSKDILKKEGHFDYFVFGHRHLALDVTLSEKSRYINLGDWLTYNSYGVFDGEKMELKFFEKEPPAVLS